MRISTDGTTLPALEGSELVNQNHELDYDTSRRQNDELREAFILKDRESNSTADKLFEEVGFSIPQEMFSQLQRVMIESDRLCVVVFDMRSRSWCRPESDTSRQTIISDHGND